MKGATARCIKKPHGEKATGLRLEANTTKGRGSLYAGWCGVGRGLVAFVDRFGGVYMGSGSI